jgi:predicted DCC family thiol-disulfide oxidoreductase YuxK
MRPIADPTRFAIMASSSASLESDAAMRLSDLEAYSYRADSAVPPFDDQGPVVFMDGDCALCTGAAKAIAKLDRAGEFRICPVQSKLGQAMLRHYGLDLMSPDSWLYLVEGRPHVSLDAVVRAGQRLGGAGRWLGIFRILPRFAQDWVYRRIARNRYSIFGWTNMCEVPDPALSRRLLS